MVSSKRIFPARLGSKERLITYGVGYGVGLGVPSILGISFALGFRRPVLLLMPVPFVLLLAVISLFRPTAFTVTDGEIIITRPVGSKSIPIKRLVAVAYPVSWPSSLTIGLIRVEGIYGAFGTFWNRKWGRFQVFVTDHEKQVELICADGARIIVSPDDPLAFVAAVEQAAIRSGVPFSARDA